MTIEDILAAVRPWDCLKDATVELPVIIEEFRGCQAILEIGTYKGATAAALAMALPCAEITTVDLPDPTKSLTNPQPSSMCGIAIRELGLAHRIEQLRMDSRNLSRLATAGRAFDGVFIDGDHSTLGVFQDLCSAAKLDAHVIVVHDYTDLKDFVNPLVERPPWTAEVHEGVHAFLRISSEFTLKRLPVWLASLRRE